MKIGIITIYNSQNCGSFLQAYALCTHLKAQGHEARLVKNHMYYKNRFFYRFSLFLKYLSKGKPKKAFRILKTYFGFRKARKKLSFWKRREKLDACLFGSDTIWNLDGAYFSKEWKHYFGKDCTAPKIAYAPSVGSTDVQKILKREELCACLRDFRAMSARDEKTEGLFCMVSGKTDVCRVIDPTMLISVDNYKKIAIVPKEQNYILFYSFGNIPSDIMDEIYAYSKENNLKIISFGESIPGSSTQLVFHPLQMLGYYEKASMIVTNTFHGNVFSILYQKPFINIDCQKAKVNDLLAKFNLSDRTVKDAKDVQHTMGRQIRYSETQELLETFREESALFLQTALSQVKESRL